MDEYLVEDNLDEGVLRESVLDLVQERDMNITEITQEIFGPQAKLVEYMVGMTRITRAIKSLLDDEQIRISAVGDDNSAYFSRVQ